IAPEELYDLCFDPAEQRNLVSDRQHQPILEEMRSRLEAWMKSTDDPLLRGPVPLVLGGHIVDKDAESPRELDRYVQKRN
ncbi:MAG TPA: hypothetical protein VGM27_04530, partial [Acidobacteriaceae bacterium]